MSVPINRPNRIHSKSKIIIPLFFSYKRILATKKTFHVIHQFDWEGLYGYVFNTIFRLEQGASFWLKFNYFTLRHLLSFAQTSRRLSHCYKVKTSDSFCSFLLRSTRNQDLEALCYWQQILTFLDLTCYWWRSQTSRVLQTSCTRRDQSVWARYMTMWSYLSVQQNIQSFNLLTKWRVRNYFKFHNYWFEYIRLTPILQADVSIPFSAFINDDLIRLGNSLLINRSFRSTSQNFLSLQMQLPLSYDLSNNWHYMNRIRLKHTSTSHFYSFRQSSLCASSYKHVSQLNTRLYRTRQYKFKLKVRTSIFTLKNHRQLKRHHRHKIHKIRNRCWRSLFKIHRSNSISFKLVRYFRRSRVYRKFIPRIIRAKSTYIPALQSISYQSLASEPKFAYLLTRDSSLATLHPSSVPRRPNMSMLYTFLLRQFQLSSTHFSNRIVSIGSNTFTQIRVTSSISQQLTLPFTSHESLVELICQNNVLLWKYNLSISVPRTQTHLSTPSLTGLMYMLSYIVKTQDYLYNSTIKRRSLIHSNLSVLHLEELHKRVVTYKTVHSRILRTYATRYMRPSGFLWYYTTLIQFLENTTGRKIALNFGPFLETALTFKDRAKCLNWKRRILGFQRILGPKIFIYEALEVLVLSIRLKDPTFLANWIRTMLARISFWKYRVIFRYLKFLLQNLIRSSFNYFNFKGAKFRLKGKISVAGNARTRMVFYRIGSTTHTTMAYRIAYDLSYVHTFTGIQGFKIWFFY